MRVIRYVIAAIVVAAAVAIVPRVGHGSSPAPQPRSAVQGATARGAGETTYATTGVVTSVGNGSLVMTRAGKPGNEIAFEVSPFAHRDGSVEIGSPVSVRYRDDGIVHVATAITVQHTKSPGPAAVPQGR